MEGQLLKRRRGSDSISSKPKRAKIDDSSDDAGVGYELDGDKDTDCAHSSDEADGSDNMDSSGEALSRHEADSSDDTESGDDTESSEDIESGDDDD